MCFQVEEKYDCKLNPNLEEVEAAFWLSPGELQQRLDKLEAEDKKLAAAKLDMSQEDFEKAKKLVSKKREKVQHFQQLFRYKNEGLAVSRPGIEWAVPALE